MTLSTPIFSWCHSTKFSGMSRRVAKKWHALGVDSDWREPILWSFLAATLTGDSLTNKPPIYRIWTTRRAPKTFVPFWRLFCTFCRFFGLFCSVRVLVQRAFLLCHSVTQRFHFYCRSSSSGKEDGAVCSFYKVLHDRYTIVWQVRPASLCV